MNDFPSAEQQCGLCGHPIKQHTWGVIRVEEGPVCPKPEAVISNPVLAKWPPHRLPCNYPAGSCELCELRAEISRLESDLAQAARNAETNGELLTRELRHKHSGHETTRAPAACSHVWARQCIKCHTHIDDVETKTALGDLRAIYELANNALFNSGHGFASPAPELPPPNETVSALEHLEAPALLRILARHVRWHDQALALLKEAASLNRTPADMARLIEFIDQSESRLVLAEKAESASCRHGNAAKHCERCLDSM